MGTIGERVRHEREAQGIERRALAEASGLKYSTLADLEYGQSKSSTKLHKIAAALGVRVEWLETGRGPKLSTDSSTERALVVPKAASVGEIAQGYRRIGLLDAVASMGDGAEIVDFPEVVREMDFSEVQLRNMIGFLPPQGRLYLMTGRGTSMEPVIKPGDVVIVDVGHHYFDGDGVYVINSGRGVQIKALQDRGDGIWIVSANPTYPPFRAEEGMVIVGKVYVRNRLDRLD